MTPDILFRLDASAHIGSGHLMRCLALADALRRRGAAVTFLLRPDARPWGDRLLAAGHDVLWLPVPAGDASESDAPAQAVWLGSSQVQDAADCLAALDGWAPASWLVVDHYALDWRWEEAMRSAARQVMVIDDLADRIHHCDLLLDQNFYDGALNRYSGRIPTSCRVLLGPRFALLREEFARSSLVDLHRTPSSVRHVLICFGGVAQTDITVRSVRALAGMSGLQVTVIAPSSVHDRLRQAAPTDIELHLFDRCDHMAALMRTVDLAIGAGGGMLWERFSQGLPSVVLGIADNQRGGIAALLLAGLVFGHEDERLLDDVGLAALIRSALVSTVARHGQIQRIMDLVDGRGADRVARQLLVPTVSFRRAQPEDSEALFVWRNHERVRRYSHDDRPIAWDSHQRWLAGVLVDPCRLLLIASHSGQPVGVVRFDLRQGRRALISIYLVPDRLQEGLGATTIDQACAWLHQHHPEVSGIDAEIQVGNRASHASFLAAGFVPDSQTLIRKYL